MFPVLQDDTPVSAVRTEDDSKKVCTDAKGRGVPLWRMSMTVKYAMLTIECGHCGSRLKMLIDVLRMADVSLACPECVSKLLVKAQDMRANLARRRLEFIGSTVPASPVEFAGMPAERRSGPRDRRRRTRAERRIPSGHSG